MFNSRRDYRDLLAALFLATLGFLFFFDTLFSGNVFFARDLLAIDVPGKVLFWKMLLHGQLPLWNPFTFSGVPFLADINLGLLSPFTLFYLFFPPLKALTVSVVAGVILAGIGMYLYARIMGVSRWGSLLTGAIFMFSGSLMTYTMNTAILNSVVWLPLLMIALEKLHRTKQVKYTIYSSIVLSLILFGGHVQYFYYTLLIAAAYIFAKPTRLAEKIVYLLYVIIPSLFLSAAQLLPFLEYSRYSTRPLQDLAYASGAAPLVSFIRLVFPSFFGVMKDGTSWGATADISGYLGIVPPVLAVFAVLGKRSRMVIFFAAASVLALTIAFGRQSPVYLAAFYILPFFSRFRSPSSILVIYTFSVALLAGWGFDYLFESVKREEARFGKAVSFMLGLCGAGTVISFYLAYASQGLLLAALVSLNLFHKTSFLTRLLEYPPLKTETIISLWTSSLFLASVFAGIFWIFYLLVRKNRCVTDVQKFILVLIVISDVMYFASNNYITAKSDLLRAPAPLTRFLEKDRSIFRILTMPDPGTKPPFGDPRYFEREALKSLDLMQPETNMLYGYESSGGYASIVPASYSAYLKSPKNDPTNISAPAPGSPELDELGVKYILTAGAFEKELDATEKYKKVLTFEDPRIRRTFRVYENTAHAPRAFTIDGRAVRAGKAVVTSYSPNALEIYAETPEAGRLVVTNQYFPGWNAYENNRRIRIEPYKNFLSVPLKPGENRVSFKYEPPSFFIGAAISAANWLYVLGFLVYLRTKKHKKISEELHIGEGDIKKNA